MIIPSAVPLLNNDNGKHQASAAFGVCGQEASGAGHNMHLDIRGLLIQDIKLIKSGRSTQRASAT
jgi:hypothetical protein